MTGQRDGVVVAGVGEQIQLLAEEIAALRTVGDDDPRRGSADRIVAVKQATIRHLRALLPGIPTEAADARRQPVGADAAAASRLAVDDRSGEVAR